MLNPRRKVQDLQAVCDITRNLLCLNKAKEIDRTVKLLIGDFAGALCLIIIEELLQVYIR